jgi:hypothetical protein
MKNTEFVERLKDCANNYKTLYVMGCFGAPMNSANKTRYINHHSYNKKAERKAMINAASADTFGFDCVCLVKGILWGWKGDKSKNYGGAVYAASGVPDVNADGMIKLCKEVSADFSKVEIGELLWLKGHVGVYIGDGLAVECTPAWKNCVQITPVLNMGTQNGVNGHKWTKHGKLPFVQYVDAGLSRAEEIAGYIDVLRKVGIISEPSKWQAKAEADGDIYHLLRKTADKF